MSDFGEGRTLKTRKPHRCEWCYQPIETGVHCYHYKGMFQDDWQDWYMHPECQESYSLNYDPDGFMPGEGERPPARPGGRQRVSCCRSPKLF